MMNTPNPTIIQGGMGIGVSGWPLARAVAKLGHLGVISGIVLEVIMVRRLQLGDAGGHVRRALGHFPFPAVAQRIISKWYIPGGKPDGQPYRLSSPSTNPYDQALLDLTIASNFVEIFLAKEGHSGLVGINYLEKVQLPTLPSLFGAMLGGVDYVLMGAGIPRAIPGVLDQLAAGQPTRLKLDVIGAIPGQEYYSTFDPQDYCGGNMPQLQRPKFLAIVSSATLATNLSRKSSGRLDGFVVEGSSAGGHNAPPRGPLQLGPRGEPIYGPRDVPDLEQIRSLGLPFWLAGNYGHPAKLAEALSVGAAGIQIGTAFAFCEESGIEPSIRRRVLAQAKAVSTDVLADPKASPTGFPFHVLQLEGTLSEEDVYARRSRVCDIGALRQLYRREDGTLGYRCSAEPVEQYLRKGGQPADVVGRKCLCNGLMSNIALAQVRRDGQVEQPLLTASIDVAQIARFLKPGKDSYTAADVVRYVLTDNGNEFDISPSPAGAPLQSLPVTSR